jgi:hypothetical protein
MDACGGQVGPVLRVREPSTCRELRAAPKRATFDLALDRRSRLPGRAIGHTRARAPSSTSGCAAPAGIGVPEWMPMEFCDSLQGGDKCARSSPPRCA